MRHSRKAEGAAVSEERLHRPLRPAPILPPPQSPYAQRPAAAGSTPGQPLPPWQARPYQPYVTYPSPPPPGPGQPPAWQYGGWPPPPPPKKKSNVGRILLGLIGLGATLLFALVLLGAAVGSGQNGAGGGFDHAPAPPDRQGGSNGSSGGANAALVANPHYAQGGLANGDCPAEDLGTASKDDQTRFYKHLMGCLNAEWRPPIEAAGFAYVEPGLVVFDSPVSTPCGSAKPQDGRTLAFYCPGDSIMYADVPQMRRYFGTVDVAYAILIGHEFGHHVQYESGILDAYDQAVYDDYSQRLILSRRTELQASCMGGLFLGAVAPTFPVDAQRLDQLEQVASSFGDPPNAPANKRDHGTGESNHDWIMRGFGDNDIAVCNTFTAPASSVD
jgi:predicted metalloprotease